MKLWGTSRPENSGLNEQLQVFADNEDEDEEFEIEHYGISHFPEAWKFLTEGHNFQWLIGLLRTEILLTKKDGTISESIRKTILKNTRTQGVSQARFEISWNLRKFLADKYPGEKDLKLGDLITIAGTGSDAQALTCAEYVRQVWPSTGFETLSALQNAVGRDSGYCHKCISSPTIPP